MEPLTAKQATRCKVQSTYFALLGKAFKMRHRPALRFCFSLSLHNLPTQGRTPAVLWEHAMNFSSSRHSTSATNRSFQSQSQSQSQSPRVAQGRTTVFGSSWPYQQAIGCPAPPRCLSLARPRPESCRVTNQGLQYLISQTWQQRPMECREEFSFLLHLDPL